MVRQLNNYLYYERIKKYQEDHNLKSDDFSFSEQNWLNILKGDNANIKNTLLTASNIQLQKQTKINSKIILTEGKGKSSYFLQCI